MLSKESMTNVLVVGIKVVKNNISIARVTGSKNDDFKIFAKIFEYFLCMWSDVDACFDDLSCGEGDWQFDIIGRRERVIAVDQCFV